jgi:site-specific recombinase
MINRQDEIVVVELILMIRRAHEKEATQLRYNYLIRLFKDSIVR